MTQHGGDRFIVNMYLGVSGDADMGVDVETRRVHIQPDISV